MPSLSATLWFVGRCLRARANTSMLPRNRQPRSAGLASQSGLSIIEVVVASLIVGLIALGTLTGFGTADRASAEERARAQATVLAQQDEETLRGLPAHTIGQFHSNTRYEAENGICVTEVAAGKWQYYPESNSTNLPFCEAKTPTVFAGQAYTGTVFKVVTTATPTTAPKGGTSASFACETPGNSADYLQTTSSVTWLANGTRAPITQSSIVTNPVSAAVEIVVKNQKAEPVSGATVKLENQGGTAVLAEQSTSSTGCAVFSDVIEPNVRVLAEKSGWVDKRGEPAAEKELKVSTTTLTKEELVIAQAGTLELEFESNGSTVGVTGETAVAVQTGIPSRFIVGGSTSKEPTSKIKIENLFPFTGEGKSGEYKLYSGDCLANDAKEVGGVGYKEEAVLPGTITKEKIEVPRLNVQIMSGSAPGSKTEGTPLTEGAETALWTNGECAKQSSQNLSPVPDEHKATVITTGSASEKGHVVTYLPYAKALTLCVVSKPVAKKFVKNKFTIANTKKEGATFTKYMKEAGVVESETRPTCP